MAFQFLPSHGINTIKRIIYTYFEPDIDTFKDNMSLNRIF